MQDLSLKTVRLRLASLAVFRSLREDPVIAAFAALAASTGELLHRQVDCYAHFTGQLLAAGGNWTDYLLERVLRNENPYVQRRGAGRPISPALQQAVDAELAVLQVIGGITAAVVAAEISAGIFLPQWETSAIDIPARFYARMEQLALWGYGEFADHHMFLLREGALQPVLHPDPVRSEALTGYERERALVEANTRALVEGKPAANVLLYGDSGTGKSTCVKAVATGLCRQGLRLIELRKNQLEHIPALLDRLSENPLKFILFIDDLSFAAEEGDFACLKAVLEGSVAAKTPNVVVYATSNRRHLVQERFSQRQGDDVHIRDTLEELGSLRERFGLTVTFLRPDRDLFHSIVAGYCKEFGIYFHEDLRTRAEAFALERGGRSARTARQFAERLVCEKNTQEGQPRETSQ